MTRRSALVTLSFLLAGCTKDLARVHVPDLLETEDEHLAKGGGVHLGWRGRPMVSPRDTWQIHTSLEGPAGLVDDDPATAGVAPIPTSKDQYILIDLRQMCTISEVVQMHSPAEGFPARYRIDAAGEHNFPYTLYHVGPGSEGVSKACLPRPIRCRFVRVTLLEPTEQPWSVADLAIH